MATSLVAVDRFVPRLCSRSCSVLLEVAFSSSHISLFCRVPKGTVLGHPSLYYCKHVTLEQLMQKRNIAIGRPLFPTLPLAQCQLGLASFPQDMLRLLSVAIFCSN